MQQGDVGDVGRQNASILLEQIEDLVKRVTELELRQNNADDEIKALSSRITSTEILSSEERRENHM